MKRPVLGIAESAVLTAMTLGQRFGIISILSRSVPRHMRYLGAMGVMDRLAGDLPLELGVADLTDRTRTFDRLCDVGATLRDAHGAEVLILGCAGMTSYRADLSDTTGLSGGRAVRGGSGNGNWPRGTGPRARRKEPLMTRLTETAQGVYVIAVTPFLPDGGLDLESTDRMVDFYLSVGATGLTVLGMMGEAQKLTIEELQLIVRRILARVAGRVPVGGRGVRAGICANGHAHRDGDG